MKSARSKIHFVYMKYAYKKFFFVTSNYIFLLVYFVKYHKQLLDKKIENI
jgi:hypothetical protein